MEKYRLFLSCGPFPPYLANRVREDCRFQVKCGAEPWEKVRTDLNQSDLLDGLEELFPPETLVTRPDWENRVNGTYYRDLVRDAEYVYAYACPALPDHGRALAALGAACDEWGRRLTLCLY